MTSPELIRAFFEQFRERQKELNLAVLELEDRRSRYLSPRTSVLSAAPGRGSYTGDGVGRLVTGLERQQRRVDDLRRLTDPAKMLRLIVAVRDSGMKHAEKTADLLRLRYLDGWTLKSSIQVVFGVDGVEAYERSRRQAARLEEKAFEWLAEAMPEEFYDCSTGEQRFYRDY